MKVNRLELVQALDAASPGLAKREQVEQSSCFIFRKGKVCTFNDEIACVFPCPLTDIECAVAAAPLQTLLSKLTEEFLEIELADGELVVKCKGKRAGIRMEAKILLPIDVVEQPKEWIELDEHFNEAISMVQDCANGNANDSFTLVCVHLHPKWMEATDNYQVARYRVATGVSEPTLIRRETIKHVPVLGMTQMAETRNWMHFRNPAGLRMACRRSMEAFPDLTPYIKPSGDPVTLPGGMADAVEKTQIFTNGSNGEIKVSLTTNRMHLTGEGDNGYYTETKRVAYEGPDLTFMVLPKLLNELSSKANECQVVQGENNMPGRLKVNGGKWVYITCLGIPKDSKQGAE